MGEHFPGEVLVKLVSRYVPVDESSVRFERVPTGHFNTTYFVKGADRDLVLRIAPPDDIGFVFYERGMMAQEPMVHRLVRQCTSVPVAGILAYDTSRDYVNRDYILMERLPGVPLTQLAVNAVVLDRILFQVGRYLREIHGITAELYGYLGPHRCMEPQSDWASAFAIMWNKLVDDVVTAGYYNRSEEVYVRGLLDQHYSVFDRPVTSRLLHMDIWAQNILVDRQGNVTGLVDFDRALWGDKEIEFAVLDYCCISELAFWEGYGIQRDMSRQAQIRRIFYLAYELQKYIVIRHYRHGDPSAAGRYKRQTLCLLGELDRYC
ncbi:MAG: phosphotransferase family protein [Armatimonadota bacterium]